MAIWGRQATGDSLVRLVSREPWCLQSPQTRLGEPFLPVLKGSTRHCVPRWRRLETLAIENQGT